MKPSTAHSYGQRIARVVEAILANPGAPHTVESLAAVAHLSPYHFHRIYRALTGESVAATVQRVRLARAAHRLTGAGEPVSAVALDVGYDSPQAFARAFRGFAGVSPSAFHARQQSLSSAQTGTGVPHVELIELAPIGVVCLRHDGPVATIGQTFRTLMRTLPAGPTLPGTPDRIGICRGDPELRDTFRYDAAAVPPAHGLPPDSLERARIEGGLYACHRLVGPYALIAPTFEALFGNWLPHSGYAPDDRPALEFYRSPPSPTQRRDCVTDLLIPLRKD
ncbi:GyrI-like domain-containing protein [Ralstonia solanacearum]|uniref:Putative transcription regulator protein n=1 Tax=Ralstonia solanacearum CFBP2957 TaxID=859656 RepID=D8P5I5_RALSL|nr:AraC family transcriptional regulator [Ralstonia solanacearum]MDB0567236.1 AraC family transcriptional regulator [Ralstonia solanacearum]MDB0577490.1 AraC family transcriptional regulator [Ralstonia solanacearum]CBJ54171.1 putative transcription regulator protein [Ralstonia solanacearum CFBP2957]